MDIVYDFALAHCGVNYLWGGKNPLVGFDCSGFVNWILHGFHLDVREANALALYEHFSLPDNHCSVAPELGALAFYGKPVDHVVLCLSALRAIGAEGGDHTVISKEVAATRGACVRLTPLYAPVGVFMPRYEELPTP
jgi:cell wall-associated NlpC family hydrolase